MVAQLRRRVVRISSGVVAFAFLVAPAVLGETFTWRTAIAAILVFAGVAITTWRRKRRGLLLSEIGTHASGVQK